MSAFSRRRLLHFGVGVGAAALGTGAIASSIGSSGDGSARSKITLIAPASPGGGWDGFARESQQAMRTGGIVNNAQVVNVPGAGGTIGLGQFVTLTGQHDTLLVTGAVMVGAIILGGSPTTLNDVTPIARLADDYDALVVPKDSPIQTLADLAAAWQADPTGFSFAGGSLGSNDQLLCGMLGRELGLNPADLNYVAYSGGGEALGSMLANTTSAGMLGFNEVKDQVEAGSLRALAVSSPERIEGVDIPTFIEGGYQIELGNWRGFVAAPGVTQENIDEFVAILTEMRATAEWQDALTRNSWTDSFIVGDEFTAFVREQEELIGGLLKEFEL
ncbi:tripartite tricarboxylate transporter substrate binding protein [Micrococcales bacterium 31B]|nr:tripartite tricarboxylate transporter substrate binding protein [Micrococcales bacterium 31B]